MDKNDYEKFMLEVKILVDAGVNIDAKDNYGNTPLHEAARQGNINIIMSLVAKGAEINAINNYGDTPLHWSAERGLTDIVDFLIEKSKCKYSK
jgi:ankyrin repeat protein